MQNFPGRGPVIVLTLIGLTTLAACGGGGGEVSIGSVTQLGYSSTATPRHSYTPYETSSHAHTLRLSDDVTEVYIGGDLEPRESLRHVATTSNGIRYQMGATRDGVGVDRLVNYAHDLRTQDDTDPHGILGHDFAPFAVQPTLYLDPDLTASGNEGILRALVDGIRLLNDALPPEFQIAFGGTRTTGIADSGEIVVNLQSPSEVSAHCGTQAVACARGRIIGDHTTSAVLHISNDFNVSDFRYSRSVIVHELLHGLGVWGHVDSVEFPDSIMGKSGEYIPNLGHIISRIDREVLQIMYMSQRTDLYNDWNEWSDTSFHLLGRTNDGNLNFGVALFNGLPQPWVRGVLSDMDLVDNRHLNGTATWNGNLLGYSGPAPIAGDAQMQVRLETLNDADNEQHLRFRDIYYLNRFDSDSPDRWFHNRDIDYKVSVSGNTFQNVRAVGYEQGHVTGAFLGPEHEHMGGTVKRTDLVGAFGGRRELSRAEFVELDLPTGHGLAVGTITVEPGGSDEHGNVVVSCPVGGATCLVTVATDGSASYARAGGVPSVMAADRSGPQLVHPEPDPTRGADHELTNSVFIPSSYQHYWGSNDYHLTGMTPVDPFPRKEILDRIGTMLPTVDSVLAIQGRYEHRKSYSTPISCRATECTYDGGWGSGPPVPTQYAALVESDEPFLFDWEREVYHKNEGPAEQLRPGFITHRSRQVYADFVNNIQGGRKYGMTLGRNNRPPFYDHAHFGIWLTDSMVIGRHTRKLDDPTFSARVYYESLGNSTGSAPLGSAIWKGQMIGASLQANPVQGDATLTFDMDSTTIDVLFHNIHNLATGTTFRDMSWPDIAVDSMGQFSANRGEYGTISLAGGSLEGRFYGEDHTEVGGVFVSNPLIGDPSNRDRNVIVRGAFAAIKQ